MNQLTNFTDVITNIAGWYSSMNFDKREAGFDKKYNKLLNAINNYKWLGEELKRSEEQLNSTLAELFFLYIDNYIPHLIMAQLDVDLDKEFEICNGH